MDSRVANLLGQWQCNAMRFDIISRSATVIDALVVVILFVPSCAELLTVVDPAPLIRE